MPEVPAKTRKARAHWKTPAATLTFRRQREISGEEAKKAAARIVAAYDAAVREAQDALKEMEESRITRGGESKTTALVFQLNVNLATMVNGHIRRLRGMADAEPEVVAKAADLFFQVKGE